MAASWEFIKKNIHTTVKYETQIIRYLLITNEIHKIQHKKQYFADITKTYPRQ